MRKGPAPVESVRRFPRSVISYRKNLDQSIPKSCYEMSSMKILKRCDFLGFFDQSTARLQRICFKDDQFSRKSPAPDVTRGGTEGSTFSGCTFKAPQRLTIRS